MRARHLVSTTTIPDAWQRLCAVARRGFLVGLAFNAAYLLSWLLIALTGSPGGTFWVMLGLVVQALALAAAVSVVVQGDGASWRNLPIPVLVLIPNGVLLATVADVSSHIGGLHLALAAAEAVALIFTGVVWLPLLLLFARAWAIYPSAGAAVRGWLRDYWRIRLRSRGMWLLEFTLLIAAWEALQPLGDQILMAVLPYPSLSSLAIGAFGIAGWSVVSGWLLPRLCSLPRVAPAVKTRSGATAIATSSPLATRLQQGSGALVGLGALSAVVFSGNLPLVALFQAALAQDQVAVVAAPIGHEFRSLGAVTVAVGDLEAALAVLAAMGNNRPQADASLREAVWWAPQSIEVERTRAWMVACQEGGKGLRPPLTVLTGKQDRAGAEQALGLWAERSGQPSRQHFFAALEADPTVSTLMPDGVPAAGPAGTGSEQAALDGTLKDNRDLMGSAVAWSVQHGSYTQAVALDDIAEGLYRNAPAPEMKPTYHHLVAAATAYAHLGSPDEAVQSLRAAYDEAPAIGDRQDVAAAALLLAVHATPGTSAYGVSPPSGPDPLFNSSDPVARFAATRGNAADHLALALFYMSRNQEVQAESQLRAALNSHPDRVIRARALAALAVHDYVTGDYASAQADARRSLDLHVRETRAVADSVLGNAVLATDYSPSALRAPSPEAETHLRASLAANPDAFMLWYALAQLESQRHDYSAALHDDLKALSAYQLVVSAGLGSYESVIGPEQENGTWYHFGGPNSVFVSAVDQDISRLQAQRLGG
jgi:tetratricopeptide (TPR) repeat protein